MLQTGVPFQRARILHRSDVWTYRETEVIREFWPDMLSIRKALPHRGEKAIKAMAKRCGVVPPKDQHIWTGAEDKKLKEMALSGAARKQIASTLGLNVTQVANRLSYRRLSIARKPPTHCPDPLAHEIRQRAFALNMTVRDLDRSLGQRQIFRNAVSNIISPKHIHRAVKALGGKLVIVWEGE